ncbi:PD-(D/E)XK nuclease family protein [Shewanella sp. 202IG2-18]|uniref:PD-(D/E)XK nuclease family protein n=1 Tax=Parashewanella hymeniacidonis TaxID=2807618 RepID=UPI00195F4F2A|nr:PD-(D/E)XK nuclease family protein [Parashewanella hymeniacidonis]MBM7070597.1 PD-(D/E)XK nuclease family protein [Parashewanella hymeniacidonis]
MDSLLVNLRKYRPRENTDPLENFVTEAFAWVLRNNSSCLSAFTKLLNEKLNLSLDIESQPSVISTQENFDGVYPDMLIQYDDFALVFEHKVNSYLHTNQLQNYRDKSKSHNGFNDCKLVLITRSRKQHEQKPDLSLCWYEIYQYFQTNLSEDEKENSWAIKELFALFKKEGLVPAKPVNISVMNQYFSALKIANQMENLINEAKLEDWYLVRECGFLHNAKKQRWGRIGLEFGTQDSQGKRRWSPGIFCGFIVDGNDHRVCSIIEDEPLTTLIIEFNDDAQEKLGISAKGISNPELHNQLVSDIKSMLLVKDFGWQVIDTLQHKTIKFNKWRPVMLMCPTSKFFDDCTSADDQRINFYKQFNELSKAIYELESFKTICEQLQE